MPLPRKKVKAPYVRSRPDLHFHCSRIESENVPRSGLFLPLLRHAHNHIVPVVQYIEMGIAPLFVPYHRLQRHRRHESNHTPLDTFVPPFILQGNADMQSSVRDHQTEQTPYAWWTDSAPSKEDRLRDLLSKEAQNAARKCMGSESIRHHDGRTEAPERPKGPGPREDVCHDFPSFQRWNYTKPEPSLESSSQSRFVRHWNNPSHAQTFSAAEAESRRRAAIRQRLEKYNALWQKLASPGDFTITIEQVPWPLLDIPYPLEPEHFTQFAVADFIFHPYRFDGVNLSHGEMVKLKRSRVKEELLRWHPDKFRARVLSKVIPIQRKLVEQCAEAVAKALNTLL